MEKNYKKLNFDEANHEFHVACIKGNLDLVKYLLTSNELENNADIHFENDECISLACRYGNLEVLKYLLTSPDLKSHANPHSQSSDAFRWACKNGHLNIIKYFLFDPSINDKFQLQKYSYEAIIRGIYYDKIEVVDYILNSTEIHHQNINYDKERILEAACECGRLDILKYLIQLPYFNQKLDFHFNNDSCFKGACSYSHLDIIEFLIFEQQLEQTEEIKNHLYSSDNTITHKINDFFKIRDLHNSLELELSKNKLQHKQLKV
jgi:ankyrin repeat protein